MREKILRNLLTFIRENKNLCFQDFTDKLLMERGLTIKSIILTLNEDDDYSKIEKDLIFEIRKELREICLEQATKRVLKLTNEKK